jgi:hypothetical protein
VRRPGITEARIALARAESIQPMGRHYAAIRTASAIYALRTDIGEESLYLLAGTP